MAFGFCIPSQVNHLWYLALYACRGVLSPSLGPTRSHLLHVYVTISLVVEGEIIQDQRAGEGRVVSSKSTTFVCLKFRASSKGLPLSRGIK